MEKFFENKIFLNRLNDLPYGKNKTLDIMKEIKEKNPEFKMDVFICILHKRINPSVSYITMDSGLYKFSVELWNQYISDNYKCDFNLLIGYEDICF
jgi:hypothetical protein